VSENRTVRSLTVAVDITHSWIGDLKVELEHNGRQVTLHAREGDSNDDLVREFSIDSFNGDAAQGSWTLLVSDHAKLDTGRLNSWSITLQF
jgi:subtilisin-like proprotein convertase family protein